MFGCRLHGRVLHCSLPYSEFKSTAVAVRKHQGAYRLRRRYHVLVR